VEEQEKSQEEQRVEREQQGLQIAMIATVSDRLKITEDGELLEFIYPTIA
jgi:hypothetical protein